MAKTVVGLMDNAADAQQVVDELVECGFERSDIGLIASESHEAGATGSPSTETAETRDTASGTLKGAGAGAALGGIAGLVVGLSSLAIPGLGPVIAAGPIASALAGAGIGAVAGGLVGALTHIGVPEEEAHYYAEGVRRGGTLVTVRAVDDTLAETAADIMQEYGAVDIKQRSEAWRQAGWGGTLQEDNAAMRAMAGERDPAAGSVRRPGMEMPHAMNEPDMNVPRSATILPYDGPERRRAATMPWTGVERRRAA